MAEPTPLADETHSSIPLRLSRPRRTLAPAGPRMELCLDLTSIALPRHHPGVASRPPTLRELIANPPDPYHPVNSLRSGEDP
ncbi:hypothetical protein ACA910_018901 [Epithemia clementina (nom. ined.)]